MLMSPKQHLQLLTFLICIGFTFGSFFVAVPNEFRPGWPLTVSVTAHQNNMDKLFINAVLRPADDKFDVYSSVSDFISPGETKLLMMQVPEIVLTINSQALLTVSTSGAVKYSGEKYLKYNPTSSLVFVETDKAIYKPGQKVQIRVVHVDKSLKPIMKPLIAVVMNPKDSKLEEFRDIASHTGVAEITYELLHTASLGKWKIRVIDEANMLYIKEFTVEEYVLPKFSVEVKANPGYIIINNSHSGSSITIEAKYTHGKGVQGSCILTLSHETSAMKVIRIQTSKQLSDTGTAEFSDLNWMLFDEIHSHWQPNVLVTATVTDETGRTEVGQMTVTIHRHNAKVEILPKSTNVFRPGLPAEIFIRVTDQGGNPIKQSEVKVEITVASMKFVQTKLTVPDSQVDVSYKFTPEVNPILEDIQFWRSRGTVKATLMSDPRVTSVVQAYLYKSEYGSAITVLPVIDKIPKVGEQFQYRIVKNSESVQQTVSYLVISQGSIIQAGIPENDVITITPTLEMCPLAKLFVYMIVGEQKSEVVAADVLHLSPTQCFAKEVDVSFDAAEVRSGADATLKVSVNNLNGSNALTGAHSVYYLGIDKSLVLLQGRTDLSKDEVLSSLSSLNLKSHSEIGADNVLCSIGKIIEDLGLAAFTSASMKKEEKHRYDDELVILHSAQVSSFGRGVLLSDVDFNLKSTSSLVETEEKKQTAMTKVRKHFPETWLWGQARTDMSGHLNHAVTLPDTITTWLVSAFAISDEGLVVARDLFELRAFQIFFLTMNLPYSIKRGEIFVLRITVFNYRTRNVKGVVRLASSAQFIPLHCQEKDGWFDKVVEIPANRAASVEYKINATTVGLIELHAVAEDTVDEMKDEVKQKLLVKPEGEMRARAITKVLLLKSESVISDTFVLNWPQDRIIPDSKSVEVKVTGATLGQSLSNLQRLVVVPYGCGEQNMVSTVPNIYGLTYIHATDQTGSSELEKDMVINMKTGYQRQIDIYKHRDGSYSAWGEQPSVNKGAGKTGGSVWLTAFVLKSFSQAAEFITVDSSVLSSGAKFLASRQESSGAFLETGQVFHTQMQSGTGAGPSLTVYVLISLLETNQAVRGDLLDIQRQINLAVGYVRESLNPAYMRKANDKFLAAMAAYALSLISDHTVDLLLNQLLSVVADGDSPWEGTGEPHDKPANGYYKSTSASYKVETAAYYLLALTRLHRLGEGLEVMKWLQSQQNSLGGYYSTQDTVMALQALSVFGIAFKSSPSASFVHVREPESGQSFNVSIEGTRAVLLHTVELPAWTRTVHVTVTGPINSSCVVKVVYSYYTLPGDDDGAFSEPQLSVYTKTSVVSKTIQKVEACIQSSKTLKYRGMFVTTLTLPSGEQALDEPSTILNNNPKASKVEVSEGVIHFYVDEAPGDGYCLHVQVERQMDFEIQKPGSAKLYAYYEPDTVEEVSLIMGGSSCSRDSCGNDCAVILNMASVVLTIVMCMLITLLLCM